MTDKSALKDIATRLRAAAQDIDTWRLSGPEALDSELRQVAAFSISNARRLEDMADRKPGMPR